jgi:hypothetical protein
VLGQVVLLRLADQYTLAAIVAQPSDDEADLRAFVLYRDGHMGVCEISNVRRGDSVNEWTAPPWPTPEPVVPPPPQLATIAADLMPAAQLPKLPPMPLMVIIRH